MKEHEILRKYRELRGLTQKEVANNLNMTHSGYSKYERGERRISIELLFKLMKILHIPSSAFGNDNEFIETDYWISYEQQLFDLSEEYMKNKDLMSNSQKIAFADLFKETFNRVEDEKKKAAELMQPKSFEETIKHYHLEDLYK